uniref:Tyrosinase copper-binding domain-containing protein n=1 Tax=Ananas comosus var. bracteatus TaxID=296719 RepID=A0A6V7QYJ0_ANACO
MGAFYSAGRDPIFFAHHGNIDRLWYLWRGLGSTHQDFTDPDWLNSTFLFYDENAQLVRVRVQDCLDTDALRYTYQDVDIPWNNPNERDSGEAGDRNRRCDRGGGVGGGGGPDGNDQLVKFDVFINAPNFYQELGPSASQCAGSFIELPEPSKNGRSTGMDTTVRFGITELLNQIGAASDKTITVTLVPRNGTVSIGGLKVEFSLPSMI